MTTLTLDRDTASKLSSKYFIENSPQKPLEGIDYTKIAKKVLNESASKIEQDIMVYAGLQWELYITDEFEEHLKLRIREWLATP
ncbi:MAG: hypothetical protein PHR94_11480 [Methylomonas lenta]|nr:hypothetical protein [Methylomonas lenta]